MIEIKFTTEDNEKHLALIPTEIASSIQDACQLIGNCLTLSNSTIYAVKQADISDITPQTLEESLDHSHEVEGAYFKGVIKYLSADDKMVKYTFVVFAWDMDDAKARVKDLIEQNSMQFAEIVKLEKSSYTLVITREWLDSEYEVSAIMAEDSVDRSEAVNTISNAESPITVSSYYAVKFLMHAKEHANVDFRKRCNTCDEPMYLYADDKYKCISCGAEEMMLE